MITLLNCVKRNSKLFFKDRGMFISAMITPMIMLVLYGTFLAKVYKESFTTAIPPMFNVDQKIIDATVGGQLLASLLAVSCITVSFCCNLMMVQDKVSGVRKDFVVTPVKKSTLALGYYLSTLVSTLIICILALGAGFIYLAKVGWYLNTADVLKLVGNVFLLTMFGTALSSIVNCFLSTQGQMSAVGTVVSAGYGFICGAYMPIASFSDKLQKVLSYLPGTYGTCLIKNAALRGVYEEMSASGFPDEAINGIKDGIDCNLYFNGELVSQKNMYLYLGLTTLALVIIYVLINLKTSKKRG